jgi:hypothetical protein
MGRAARFRSPLQTRSSIKARQRDAKELCFLIEADGIATDAVSRFEAVSLG